MLVHQQEENFHLTSLHRYVHSKQLKEEA